MARPSKYKSEYAQLAYNYCLLGATDKELASFFDVDEATINRWKLSEPEFCESLKRGKEKADALVASKLFHRAIGYEHEDTQFATFQGEITDQKTYIKHYAPDTTAAIFWLKNRQPSKWRDKTEVEANVKGEVKNSHDLEETLKNDPESRELLKQLYRRTGRMGSASTN